LGKVSLGFAIANIAAPQHTRRRRRRRIVTNGGFMIIDFRRILAGSMSVWLVAFAGALLERASLAGELANEASPVAAGELQLANFADEDGSSAGLACGTACDHSCEGDCFACGGVCFACGGVEEENFWDTISLFGGLEGSKQPQDFGINAHFGGRAAVNGGLPLWREYGLGLQLGTSINATGNAVQVMERVEGTTGRFQSHTTITLFQRTSGGLVWSAGHDFLYQDYYDNFFLGQWRGRVGQTFWESDELGLKGSLRSFSDDGDFLGIPLSLRPLNQGAIYWQHRWPNLAQISCWTGLSEGHAEANVALGDLPRTGTAFLFGSDLYIPLNNCVALFGEANFIMPADTGTVDAYLGIEFYPWGGARRGRRATFAPVMPVAGNPTMSVDLERR
jgi:hypothetical protein